MVRTLLYLALSWAAACSTPASDDEESASETDAGDSDLADASDTTSGNAFISDIRAEVSEAISTVATVRWSTPVPTVGRVAFGPQGSLGMTTPMEEAATTEHERLLLGLTANTEHQFQIEVEHEGATLSSDRHPLYIDRVPASLPKLTATGDGHPMYTIVTLAGATNAVVIIDGKGEYVWYQVDERDLDLLRARLSLDGQSLLYNAASVAAEPGEPTEIVRVSMDGTVKSAISVPLLTHDFVELPDGTLAAIAVEYQSLDGEELRGDRIVEISPDGAQTTVWHSWDCFDPQTQPGEDPNIGWAFANALDYDPAEDVYYLGMMNFSSIAKIDRATKACLWVLGSTAETVTFTPGTHPFLHQHQFQVLESSILVMDNDGRSDGASQVVEYALDLTLNTAEAVWTYTSTPKVSTFVLGEPTRLDDGDTFINWSAAGKMERVSSDGTQKWQLTSRVGCVFGYHTLASTLYGDGIDDWAMSRGEAHRLQNGNTLANYGTGGVIREITPDKETACHVELDADFDEDTTNHEVGHHMLTADLYALCRGWEE
jgi:hypothetical protein